MGMVISYFHCKIDRRLVNHRSQDSIPIPDRILGTQILSANDRAIPLAGGVGPDDLDDLFSFFAFSG